jgi:DNA-binding FadR family transcriptional regulator
MKLRRRRAGTAADGDGQRALVRNAAQRLAREMEQDILQAGPADGELIGSEAELLSRYQVSRTVLREAVRILEHDGIAMMRRGPSGGLIATLPQGHVVTHALELYLRHRNLSIASLMEARIALEADCARWAAERIEADSIADLRHRVKAERQLFSSGDRPGYSLCAVDFHVRLAQLSKNDAAALFVQVLVELTNASVPMTKITDAETLDSIRGHELISEAVVSGDAALASHHMIQHLELIRQHREFY